ncbi:hypothetical protein [Marinilactibacillus kalidii]|uniref:hypothetical protein n=1 Tax=Marinilactibacillus kalidii TaxID=2820274 RepID=UPI001ABDC992|nr:hypothetical protein [Marinilactibacillus kalidii]
MFFAIGKPTTLDMFYVIFGLMLTLTLLLNVLSKKNQRRLFHDYYVLAHKRDQYHWDQIILIRKKVFFICLIFSGIVILLTHLFGLIISNIGIIIGTIIFVVGLSFGEPKKNKRSSFSDK